MIGLNINTTVTVSIGAILIYLVTTWINNRLSKTRTDEDRRAKDFNAAAETFRNTFTAMQQYLFIHSTSALLFKQFPLHNAARINFIHHLNGKERRRFDKVWQKFEQTCKEVKSNAKEELIGPASPRYIELRQEISECIEELLFFAKPK